MREPHDKSRLVEIFHPTTAWCTAAGAVAGCVLASFVLAVERVWARHAPVSDAVSSLLEPTALSVMTCATLLLALPSFFLGRELTRASLAAGTDALTGLANRRLFKVRLTQEMRRKAQYAGRAVVLAIDLDRMKAINDCLGHAGGDRALVLVANVLRRCVRSTDLAARIGGDEFAVLLSQHGIEQARAVAQRIADLVATEGKTWPVKLSVSVGVSEFRASLLNEDDLLGAADRALYQAKQAGRNRVVTAKNSEVRSTRPSFLTLTEAALVARRTSSTPETHALALSGRQTENTTGLMRRGQQMREAS